MGNEKQNAHHRVYINVMELLVAEEVDRQLKRLPERILKYIKCSEVETFALNRLPALYASSEKGLQHQRDYASRELKQQIENSVRQALVAVQIDPIRLSQPLHLQEENSEAIAVLQALKECLHSPDLTWKTALSKLQNLQRRRANTSREADEVAGRTMTSGSSTRPHSGYGQAWRPGTYGSRVSWRSPQQRPSSTGGFDDTPHP